MAPLKIGIAPISIFAGLYAFVAVGFTILVGIISPIPLQTPELYGGYGFSALQNALCMLPWSHVFKYQSNSVLVSFTGWAGIIAAQLLGYLLGDRIPLWASHRGGGIWHPEYRLWNMLIPGLFCKFESRILIQYSRTFLIKEAEWKPCRSHWSRTLRRKPSISSSLHGASPRFLHPELCLYNGRPSLPELFDWMLHPLFQRSSYNLQLLPASVLHWTRLFRFPLGSRCRRRMDLWNGCFL